MITLQQIFRTVTRDERRPASVVAESYGLDVGKMLHSDDPSFTPEMIGLYARIAAHFGAKELNADESLHVVCAWCNAVLQEGESRNPHNISHGICPACFEKEAA
jgi:hypothetical protein